MKNDLEIAPTKCVGTSPNLQKDFGLGVMVVTSNSIITKSHPYLQMNILEFVKRYSTIEEVSVKKVIEAIECLLEIFHLFGLKRIEHTSPFSDQIKYYEQKSLAIRRCLSYMEKQGSNSWIQYFKYKICAFYAYFEQQDLPAKPPGFDQGDKPNTIFGGYLLSFQKKLQLDKELWNSFILTILQSKMGFPRASEQMIREAEEKTALKLTTAPASMSKLCLFCGMPTESHYHQRCCDNSEDRYLNADIRLNVETLKTQLRRTTREMFQGVHYSKEVHYEPFFPSTSANYIRSRGNCGAVGVIQTLIAKMKLAGELSEEEIKDLVIRQEGDCFARGEVSMRYGSEGIEHQILLDEEKELGQISGEKCILFDDSKLKKVWIKVMDRLKLEAMTEEPLVEPVGLAEALKIRVISKGPPHIYSFLKPLQKLMWSSLKNNLVFKMIGTPFEAKYIQERIGKVNDEEIVINGDYKASTDNLHSWVSSTIVTEMISCFRDCYDSDQDYEIDEEFEKIFMTSLINHKFKVNGSWEDQKEGQLMGSVTSFPILCLANAAMCRWALEIANGKTYHLKDTDLRRKDTIAPLLVNGDDCTLKGNRKNLREIWEKITTFGGLETSIGKTLFSNIGKPIVVLNSKTFHYDEEWGTWDEKKFVNMGILLGKVRSSSGETNVRGYGQMGTLHRKLKEQSPDTVWKEVSSRFIHYNRETLEKCPNIPWNMPEYLGGPGLVSIGMSKFDRRAASIIIMKMNTDPQFRIVKETIQKNWIMHDLVMEKLREFDHIKDNFNELKRDYQVDFEGLDDRMNPYDYGFDNDFRESEFPELYKALTIELLFSCKLSDMFHIAEDKVEFRKIEKDLAKRNMRARTNNMKVWKRAIHQMDKIFDLHVRSEIDILYEKKLTEKLALKDRYLGKEFEEERFNGIEGLAQLRELNRGDL